MVALNAELADADDWKERASKLAQLMKTAAQDTNPVGPYTPGAAERRMTQAQGDST